MPAVGPPAAVVVRGVYEGESGHRNQCVHNHLAGSVVDEISMRDLQREVLMAGAYEGEHGQGNKGGVGALKA
jgi:hypothetical protein